MQQSKMPYENVFRAPLEIANAFPTLRRLTNEKGCQLADLVFDVRAKAGHSRSGLPFLNPPVYTTLVRLLAGYML
ncbi:hypothetical protein, partial [Salmonella enterica]|uniref:hypothetical protein n=1 Tax=Salmonella enterica TaxID=28901 RepID=UPI00398C780E